MPYLSATPRRWLQWRVSVECARLAWTARSHHRVNVSNRESSFLVRVRIATSSSKTERKNLLVLVHIGGYHASYEKPPEHCEVTPEWIPTRCARSKTDAPPSKNVRSNRRADSGPDPRDTRTDIRRLHSGGGIAEQDREVSGAPGR